MDEFRPDPVILEVLKRGTQDPHLVRLELPDGSTYAGSVDIESLRHALKSLEPVWLSEEPKDYGIALFNHLFDDGLKFHLGEVRGSAGSRGVRVLLRLDAADPSLHTLPWERLYLPHSDTFAPISADQNLCFSRYLTVGRPWGLPKVAGPLRVLVVAACPYPPDNDLYFDAERECQVVVRDLEQMEQDPVADYLAGQVTLDMLAERLRQGDGYDILHFIGHGQFETASDSALLILAESEHGYPEPVGVSDRDFVERLGYEQLPRLICLCTCQSAQMSEMDAFTGLGPRLVVAGCPAVVCMQGVLRLTAAQQFTRRFYAHLMGHGVVDWAVSCARREMYSRSDWQWALPVLFMRLPNGILFTPQSRRRGAKPVPYKGLAPYTRDDANLFYGRQHDVSELCEKVRRNPVSIVYGRADVGLTSLMQAGVVPVLEDEGNIVVCVSEYGDFVSTIRTQLRADGRPLRLHIPGDAPLANVLLSAVAEHGSTPEGVVLILDQFERCLAMAEDSRAGVFQALAASAAALGDLLRIVFVLNEEGVNQLRALLDSAGLPGTAETAVDHLSQKDAAQAVRSPLEYLHWPATLYPATLPEDRLVPDVAELSGSPGSVEPASLQLVCSWLYRESQRMRTGPVISSELYERGKAAEGIVARFLDETLGALGPQRQLGEQALVSVIDPGLGAWVSEDQITVEGSSILRQQVLGHLVHANLLSERWQNGDHKYTLTCEAIRNQVNHLIPVEERQHAKAEVERIWDAWLVRNAIATRGQLRYMQELDSSGDTEMEPVQALLLLRSAVTWGEDLQPWLQRLRRAGGEHLIRALEVKDHKRNGDGFGISTLSYAKELLGLKREFLFSSAVDAAQLSASEGRLPDRLRGEFASHGYLLGGDKVRTLQAGNAWKTEGAHYVIESIGGSLAVYLDCVEPLPPSADDRFGDVSWSAVTHYDEHVRQTAAVALATLKPSEMVGRLNQALTAGASPWRRPYRTAELRAVQAEADPEIDEAEPIKSPLIRSWIWAWRVRRNIDRDASRIVWLTVGGAVGAGLGYGLLRAFTAGLLNRYVGTAFFVESWVGAILGAALTLGLFVGEAMTLNARSRGSCFGGAAAPARRQTSFERRCLSAIAPILLGTLFFGLAQIGIAMLIGASRQRVLEVNSLGFLAGLGLAFALHGQPAAGWRLGVRRWLLRLGAAAATMIAAQMFFVIGADEHGRIAVVWSSSDYFADLPAQVSKVLASVLALASRYRAVPAEVTGFQSAVIDLAKHPVTHDLMSVLDGAAVGVVLAAGTTAGLLAAAHWLSRWYRLNAHVRDG